MQCMQLGKTAQLKVENSNQTDFKISPLSSLATRIKQDCSCCSGHCLCSCPLLGRQTADVYFELGCQTSPMQLYRLLVLVGMSWHTMGINWTKFASLLRRLPVCVCECVCVWERERGCIDRCSSACVCVCVFRLDCLRERETLLCVCVKLSCV